MSFFSDSYLFRLSSVIILLFWFLSSCSYREYFSTSDRLLGSFFFSLPNIQAFWSNSSPDEFYRKSCRWIDWDANCKERLDVGVDMGIIPEDEASTSDRHLVARILKLFWSIASLDFWTAADAQRLKWFWFWKRALVSNFFRKRF